ncbi:DNA-directed RNA polymerase specialized sigma24 family protein [Metabacillus malikii]|uniref:DNA-directed RNA polymerase specialized sigma24 family protein n=1 Tax=Metabacillus malikii TaxID=1504265 RepID=A0ABT9ZMZ2_9BACI|nr:DNA-directed RNA polymerase specialized sigma24 family protein [Metabacillus malikii]
MDTVKLVQKATKGDDEAFEQLISTVRHKLYRTAYSYVKNEQDALDIYQDTIYKAYTVNSHFVSSQLPQTFPNSSGIQYILL